MTTTRPAVTFGYAIAYVPDVSATLDFYARAFGLTQRFVTAEADYGELDTGAVTLAFATESLARTNLADTGGFAGLAPSAPPPGLSLTMLADDVPAAVERAISAGAAPYTAPIEKPWGQTVAYVRDPNGLLIELATPMTN